MRYLAVILILWLGGCAILEDEAGRNFARVGGAQVPATITTADVRLVMERRHPLLGTMITCTEPSPDIAKALSATASLSGQGGNGTITAGAAFGAATAEAVAELAGRSTALLGLRDGLYRACEAFANGAIGADAYALVLSRYGQLMTTMFLGQNIAGATVKTAAVQSPPVSVTVTPGAKDAGSTVTAKTDTGSGGATGGSTDAAKAADVPALALARMNEDYMNLDLDMAHLLASVCINDADPTRLHGYALVHAVTAPGEVIPLTPSDNPWLRQICPSLARRETLDYFKQTAIDFRKNNVTAPPVNPVPGAAPAKADTTNPGKPTPDKIKMAQQALAAVVCNGCNPHTTSGKLDAASISSWSDTRSG